MNSKRFLVAFLFSLSSSAFALDSGYQNVGRIQQWTIIPAGGMAAPGANVFLVGPGNPNSCNQTGIYTFTHEQVESARGKSAMAMILAAKMAGKKINITYECTGGSPNMASIWGVDVE